MNTSPLCERLPWDSEHFGFEVARVIPHRLTAEQCESIETWARRNAVRCLYFLAEVDDPVTIALAEEYDYHFADIRITFSRDLDELPRLPVLDVAPILRPATESDLPALQAMGDYRKARFFLDTHFPEERAIALYEAWVLKSYRGYADFIWVVELQGAPVGYITCHLADTGVGSIGLVNVKDTARGMGLGTLLLSHALHWFVEQGMTQVLVVTQGGNIPSQRLYQRQGFVTHCVRLWYHRWFA